MNQPLHGNRRSFLQRAGALGALAIPAAALLSGQTQAQVAGEAARVTDDDVAVLKFLAAAELVEDDLWQQYAEVAQENGRYKNALVAIDQGLPRYISQDRDDERSHASFINAFLVSIGEQPVNLDPFRTLPSAPVQGAQQVGRLTNLTNLTIDTSWYYRYRSKGNPDFGDEFPQIVEIVNRPAIPTSNTLSARQLKVIAQTAAFHFATIEQGGSSLYLSLLTKVTHLDVLSILGAIGPVEVYHFSTFHKVLENITSTPAADGVAFPNLRINRRLAESHFPEPCVFLERGFPFSSVIRPMETATAGAVAAATGLVKSGLFQGQSQAFFDAVVSLATAADAARRTI